MSLSGREKVVFDCTIFARALISPRGPAGACITYAQNGRLTLFASAYVLQEIRDLPLKIKPKYGVTAEKTEQLIADLGKYASAIDDVPSVYDNPLDPDDSHYINLAVATNSKIVISRDPHLLRLIDRQTEVSREFVSRFPTLEIISPDALAQRIRAETTLDEH